MKKIKLLSLLAVLVMICVVATCALVACEGKVTAEIKLSQTELKLVEGGVMQLTATVTGTDEETVWTVDKDDVVSLTKATRDNLYTVKALKAGTATITVKAGDATATCLVTVSEKEVVTIANGSEDVTGKSLSIDMGTSITLVAKASQNSPITWSSSDDNIATVNGGVVKGEKPGVVTITAKVSDSVKAEVQVTVNSVGGYEYYKITLKNGASDAAANPGKWAYWTEWAQFTTLEYDNGTVNVDFIENGGNWYNLQLFYVNTSIDPGKYYKMTIDIDSSVAGHVTINGFVVELQTGKHTYDIYFVNGTGVSMQFGVEGGIDGDTGTVIDMPVGKVSISNIRYAEDTSRVTLVAPNFTYDSNSEVITIVDDNPAGVKNYVLSLYQNNKLVSGVTLKGSGKIDWSMVVSGTYQAKLKAVAMNVHYDDSVESAAQEIVVVNDRGIHYEFSSSTPKDGNGVRAKQNPGVWTYWSESWVVINGAFENNMLTVSFSNNTGNWYDTQLNYRQPGLESGKLYKLQLEIDSTAGGRVTLNAAEFTILEGKHTYDIVFLENGELSIQITFGLNGQDNQQEIPSATMKFVIKGVNETTQTSLTAPSFTLGSDNKITITDTNTAGVKGYELGFFQSAASAQPVKTVTIANGDTVNPNVVGAGTYTLKLRAVAANAGYATSAWSTSTATVTSTSTSTPIEFGENGVNKDGSLKSALANPDQMYYWNNQGWINGNWVTVTKAEVSNGMYTFTYSGADPSVYQGFQLFYKNSANEIGKRYTVSFTLNASVGGVITVNGEKVTLTQGDNKISVTYTEPNYEEYAGASLAIQFGHEGDHTVIAGGTFVLSGLTFTAA